MATTEEEAERKQDIDRGYALVILGGECLLLSLFVSCGHAKCI